MITRYFPGLFVVFLHLSSSAQSPAYEDLLVLYVDDKFEKCIDKAERYASKDDTRKDPLPYLYMSMCYFEMSKKEAFTSQKEFKYAARDALKYAVKFRKKDTELAYVKNYEDFWSELNTRATDEGLYFLDTKAFSKAKRKFTRMVGYLPENPGAWQMLALAQAKMNLVRDAGESMKSYGKALAAVPDPSRLPPDQARTLRISMIRYAEHLLTKGQRDQARATMAKGKDLFMDNPEFRSLYDQLAPGSGGS